MVKYRKWEHFILKSNFIGWRHCAGVIEGVTGLNQIRLLTLQDEIHRVLRDCPNLVSSVDPLFDNEGIFGKPFLGLETKHHQMSALLIGQ